MKCKAPLLRVQVLTDRVRFVEEVVQQPEPGAAAGEMSSASSAGFTARFGDPGPSSGRRSGVRSAAIEGPNRLGLKEGAID